MDDDLRATPRSETKYGDRVSSVDEYYPWQCALCDATSETTEDHEQHMQEVHEL